MCGREEALPVIPFKNLYFFDSDQAAKLKFLDFTFVFWLGVAKQFERYDSAVLLLRIAESSERSF